MSALDNGRATAGLAAVLLSAVGLAAPAAGAGEVWVTNMQSANVQVFDPGTLDLLATIPAARGAHNVTLSPDGRRAFVANVDSSSVTVIDAERKVALATVPAGPKAHDVAVSPDGRLAVAADVGADTVAVIDVARLEPLGVLTTGPKAMWRGSARTGPCSTSAMPARARSRWSTWRAGPWWASCPAGWG